MFGFDLRQAHLWRHRGTRDGEARAEQSSDHSAAGRQRSVLAHGHCRLRFLRFWHTRTGTNRCGKSYSYYSCAGCQQKGKSVCNGRHIPAAVLDDIVLNNLKKRLLTPERLASVLEILADRQSAKTDAVDRRLVSLQREVSDTDERLRRLYRSIEDGIVELDDILRERTASLKSERERAKAAYDRARAQCGAVATIDSVKIDAFARLVTDKLDNGDTNARKSYIRSIIDAIEVDDKAIRIVGSNDVLQAVIAGKQNANGNVRGFVRKWRAREDEDGNHYVVATPIDF
jgi:site-specific DNA recombinase